ncbi:MAG: phosphoenolpyruvate--protein phosphotransferase [Alkalispirochaeta sp.]
MELIGVPASPGVARGRAVVLAQTDLPPVTERPQSAGHEISRFQAAVTQTVSELVQLQQKTRHLLGAEFAEIFRSQQTIAEDEDIRNAVIGTIHRDAVRAETALHDVFEGYRALFTALEEDAYNRSRISDVEDVHVRMQRILRGIDHPDLTDLPGGSVIVATELFPSDTALIDAEHVVAIVTELGGPTSHAAILAKSLGVPAIVRVRAAIDTIRTGDDITVVADPTAESRVFVNPGTDQLARIRHFESRQRRRREEVDQFRGQAGITPDGKTFSIAANIGSTQELGSARTAGATAVGLYRSEFLFFRQPVLPNEEIQFAAYREAVRTFPEGGVVIRTLDIGGDKQLPALPIPIEANPFLGMRALRFTLVHRDLFLTQIRAILRAGAEGAVRILLPMVGGVDEVTSTLELIEEAKEGLRRQGIPHDPDVEVGVMIEVPSAVWIADVLSRYVSFFSVGTNDLIQYLMAADRLNANVEEYYRPYDPSLFRAIAYLTERATAYDRPVAVCGELGGDPLAIPALGGLGITEFSMSPLSISEATRTIRTTPYREMKELSRRVLELDSYRDIKALLEEHYREKE